MILEDIKKEYEKDSVIDSTELDKESLRIPQLHGKYLAFLLSEKSTFKKMTSEYSSLYKFKWEYYTGKSSPEELKARKVDPFPLKILKTDIDVYINGDEELNTLSEKIEAQKSKIDYLESVIKEINSRQWNIRNAIEWRRFTTGLN